ncbi:MAG: PAS domain S-box protein, partial [Chloroflexota bacterium]|nr:PAS domain S-box protein [Chloroflexota bacterium]
MVERGDKTKKQLMSELSEMRRRIAELETLETEHKQSEEALRETNQTLQALIATSPLAIIAVDLDGNVTLWNKAAEHIFGWSEEEVLGRPHPIVSEDRWDEFQENIDLGLRGKPLAGLEARRQKKDGSSID